MHTSSSVVKEEELGKKNAYAKAEMCRSVHTLGQEPSSLGLTPAWCPWPPSQKAAAGTECCCPIPGVTHSCRAQTDCPTLRPGRRVPSSALAASAPYRILACGGHKRVPHWDRLLAGDRFAAAAQISWVAWGPWWGLARDHSRCSQPQACQRRVASCPLL